MDGNKINLEFDSETGDYYIVWRPIVIGAGRSAREALEDLRVAAHFGADKLIELEFKNIIKEV